jgi:type II secretory pathway component PulC
VEIEGSVRVLSSGEHDEGAELLEIARRSARMRSWCGNDLALTFDDLQPVSSVVSSPQAVSINVAHVVENLEEIAKEAKWIPKFENGVMSIRVLSIRPGGLIQRSGLQNGDIIQNVDGRPIQELSRLGILDELKAKGTVQVQIKRAGATIQIPVSLF